jgi:putative long chain acyl-CoA synthase
MGSPSFTDAALRRFETLGRAVQNALEVARLGQLGTAAYTPYTVVAEGPSYRLRRYAAQPEEPRAQHPVLLVPGLLVSSDVYDLEPGASAVAFLAGQGLDVFLCDFDTKSAQAERPGSDAHVRAIDQSIELVRELTGRDVHLMGYSQGGMFAYQVAALRRSEGIKSIVTFASLVDVHANMAIDSELLGKLRGLLLRSIGKIDAIPGGMSSLLFKLLSLDRRAAQFVQFVGDLDDRLAIEHGERKRHLVAGESLVSWPGLATARFADEFVLSNRMLHGGFVIDGRACSLADITCAVLYFVGERDEVSQPRAVQAIRKAAVCASEMYEINVPTGHIGLIAGKKAFEVTWPSVVEWCRFREGLGPKPGQLVGAPRRPVEAALDDVRDGLELVRGAGTGVASTLISGAERLARRTLTLSENLRFQVTRLYTLGRIRPETRVSFGRALSRRARANPHGTWFIYDGRGQSYAEADQRVDDVVKGLIACGVRPNQHVGVLMQNRPSYLSLVTALSRLGAVAVLLSPSSKRASLERALSLAPVDVLVSDPDNIAEARESFGGKLLMLGAPKSPRPHVRDVIDMEVIHTGAMAFPDWYQPDPGRAEDLAMIIFTAGRFDEPRAARITNRRWAVAAYGVAAAASLGPKDTVYACTPLHHASGMLVAVGGALVGGARLALAQRFSPERFWPEVRRYDATVVFYAGEMLRELVDAPSYRGEHQNPLRLFAGSGMRADIWRRLVDRFGSVGVLEFYASTEGTGVLANVAAEKVGSLGRPLPGLDDMLLCAYDFEQRRLYRDAHGMCVPAEVDEPGVLLTRVDASHPQTTFDGYVDDEETANRLRRDVRERGDTWFLTGDVMRKDEDGDYWFLDRLSDVTRTPHGPVFTRPVEDALYQLPEIRLCAVYAGPDAQATEAVLVLRKGRKLEPEALTRCAQHLLEPHARPRLVKVFEGMALTDGNRPLKTGLGELSGAVATFRYDEVEQRYLRLDAQRGDRDRAVHPQGM